LGEKGFFNPGKFGYLGAFQPGFGPGEFSQGGKEKGIFSQHTKKVGVGGFLNNQKTKRGSQNFPFGGEGKRGKVFEIGVSPWCFSPGNWVKTPTPLYFFGEGKARLPEKRAGNWDKFLTGGAKIFWWGFPQGPKGDFWAKVFPQRKKPPRGLVGVLAPFLFLPPFLNQQGGAFPRVTTFFEG